MDVARGRGVSDALPAHYGCGASVFYCDDQPKMWTMNSDRIKLIMIIGVPTALAVGLRMYCGSVVSPLGEMIVRGVMFAWSMVTAVFGQ